MGRLDGKVAIITGASSGIGRSTAEAFGREGAKVVATSRSQDKLDALVSDIESAGGTALAVAADLEDPECGRVITQAALDAYGQVDVLVSNAGVGWQYGIDNPGTMAGIHEASLDNWRAIIGGVDLEGYYLVINAVLPHMLERKTGSIVLVSSMAGLTGLYDAHAYTAAKGAILNLGRSMAITYVKQGVRTNTVCPGFIDTPMIAPVVGAFEDPAVAGVLCPMARPGRPEEIAGAILFLASDEASYCNGATLVVDGGSTARSFAG